MGRQEIPQEEFFKKLVLFLREHILSSGMSLSFTDFFDFPAYYRQARAILDYGLKFHPTQWHYRFSSFALPFILQYGIYSLPAVTLIPKQVADILNYDQLHDSEYYETFAAYLRNQMSITETAKALYIHPSTLKYRLNRLEQFMEGYPFRKNEGFLYLLNIFQLIEHPEN